MKACAETLAARSRQVLGVKEGDDVRTIKKAYRRLARQYHPDAHAGAGEDAKFLLITEAYEYLLRHKPPGRNSLLAASLTLEKEEPEDTYARWWLEHYGDFF
ncbi:DnaJ domain-containing protein [Neomoorella thermoacetica]|uniref:DnaJ domain-containing protein n=1 Tax=Neomoorella thermoacetica TaxID=1525 RepID=UPI0009C031A4|nr:DnaJ domain-containing protein [Moorella thermoacetica]